MQQQSILNFLNQFLFSSHKINSIINLSDGLVFLKILSSIEQLKIDLKQTKEQPQNWQQRLTNLRYLMTKINKYSEPQMFCLDSQNQIDLLEIAKNQNQNEIINLFEKVLGVMLSASNKNEFIEKIMSLSEQEQEHFKDKIVKSMKDQLVLSPIQSPRGRQNQSLLLKLGELEEELKLAKEQTHVMKMLNREIGMELQNYKEQNEKLKENGLLLEKEIMSFRLNEERVSQDDLSDSKNVITSLQNKLVEQSEEYEKRYAKLEQQLILLRNNSFKGEKASTLLSEAQLKIRDLSEKILNLKQQNNFLTDKTIDLQTSIKILQQKIEAQNTHIAKVEFQKISLKADNAKFNARSSELQKLLSMSFEQRKPTSQRLQTETLQKLQDPFETKYDEVKEELNIANRRVKELEREMARSNLRLEKLEKVEGDKKKLEEVLVDYKSGRAEEVGLLTYALYELRVRYGELVKKQQMEDSTINSISVE